MKREKKLFLEHLLVVDSKSVVFLVRGVIQTEVRTKPCRGL